MATKHWETDERRFNCRGGPSIFRKVRVIVGTNANPIAFGITIPTAIATEFSGCQLKAFTSGGCIILESGCKD